MIPSGYEILALPVFIIGVVLLWKGSDILVDGTSKTAVQLGISSLIISVILVGFGTSAPEFAISGGSAIQQNSDICFGNIVGSCIANLFLVLGISSVIRPIDIKTGILRREFLIMLVAAFILVVASFTGLLDGDFHQIGGVLFLFCFAIFVFYFIHIAHKERVKPKKKTEDKLVKNLLFILIGIAGVVLGATFLIDSAVVIATSFGISQFVIALSLVAIGTSLPELVVSSMAAYKEKDDIAVGNVLGSNVFNILLILGFAALFIPLNASGSLDHIIILIIVTLLMFPILITGKKITRFEGIFMIIGYIVYMWYSYVGCNLICF